MLNKPTRQCEYYNQGQVYPKRNLFKSLNVKSLACQHSNNNHELSATIVTRNHHKIHNQLTFQRYEYPSHKNTSSLQTKYRRKIRRKIVSEILDRDISVRKLQNFSTRNLDRVYSAFTLTEIQRINREAPKEILFLCATYRPRCKVSVVAN